MGGSNSAQRGGVLIEYDPYNLNGSKEQAITEIHLIWTKIIKDYDFNKPEQGQPWNADIVANVCKYNRLIEDKFFKFKFEVLKNLTNVYVGFDRGDLTTGAESITAPLSARGLLSQKKSICDELTTYFIEKLSLLDKIEQTLSDNQLMSDACLYDTVNAKTDESAEQEADQGLTSLKSFANTKLKWEQILAKNKMIQAQNKVNGSVVTAPILNETDIPVTETRQAIRDIDGKRKNFVDLLRKIAKQLKQSKYITYKELLGLSAQYGTAIDNLTKMCGKAYSSRLNSIDQYDLDSGTSVFLK